MTLPTFVNSDARLRAEADQALARRAALGLEGLTGGLEAVVIGVEPDRVQPAAAEILATTGYAFREAWEDDDAIECWLAAAGSADILLRARKRGENPFSPFNQGPKACSLPNTRLETLLFSCHDLERYVSIQREAGVRFQRDGIERRGACAMAQTMPSRFTGNAVGMVSFSGAARAYAPPDAKALAWKLPKPQAAHLAQIRQLDHVATRVRAQDRDPAIIEFLGLTDYRFDFAIYVELLNSITNVARLPGQGFALVFTSGIAPFVSDQASGPTEKFVQNYGPRAHHMAFHTEAIEETFEALKRGGMEFLVELVGSPEEGLKQTFSNPLSQTMIVNEYIHRYGGFDGFFTKSNVTLLTAATGRQ